MQGWGGGLGSYPPHPLAVAASPVSSIALIPLGDILGMGHPAWEHLLQLQLGTTGGVLGSSGVEEGD